MLRDIITKNKGIILFTIGSLLIVLTVFLGLSSRIILVKEKVFSEIEMLINTGNNPDNDENEDNNNNNNNNDNDNENIIIDSEIDINTGFIDSDNSVDDGNDIMVSDEDIVASKDNENKKKYIGYLNIPKISLNYGYVEKDSYYNNEGGNFIIAGHSGTSEVSYFKSLYRLKIGDIAKVIYQNKTYTYKIVSIYKEVRDGSVNIKRDTTKTTLTLITCSYKDRKHQTIYIAELDNVEGD